MRPDINQARRAPSADDLVSLSVTQAEAWHEPGGNADQQPEWTSHPLRESVCRELMMSDPLVEYKEIRALHYSLADVASGKALLLQAGDCAESFDESARQFTLRKLQALDQLGDRMSARAGIPVIRIARIGGQFAKPRSRAFEQRGKVLLPSFRGHLINSEIPNLGARRHNPLRMLRAYEASMTVLRATAAYRRSLDCGHGSDPCSPFHAWGPWASHEALVLDYELNLLRTDYTTGDKYLSSTHLPWIGVRTNKADGMHVKMLANVRNPVACKIGPASDPAHVLRLCETLNPKREVGRLVLIARFGRDFVKGMLPPLAMAVRDSGHPAIWLSDPMHGNTIRSASGLKTRRLDDMLYEMTAFCSILERIGVRPSGLHLEVAASAVTECLGGSVGSEHEIPHSYTTLCDPRLNLEQALLLIERWVLASGAPWQKHIVTDACRRYLRVSQNHQHV